MTDPVPATGSAEDEVDFDWDWDATFGSLGTETLACYLPWHVFRPVWGIVLNQPSIDQYAQRFAAQCGCTLNEIRQLVTRQVIEHEYVHFEFEVIAAQIEDAIGDHRYIDYLWHRYHAVNDWTEGALEELIATAAERAFSLRRKQLMPNSIKPSGYTRAVPRILRTAPPGYRDYHKAANAPDADQIARDLIRLIAAEPGMVASGMYPRTSPTDRAQVPIIWDGGVGFEDYGLARNVPQIPTVRNFEDWVENVERGKLSRGTKHYKATFANGRTSTYSRPKQTASLYRDQVGDIAKKAGLRKASDLNFCVAEGLTVQAYVSSELLAA